MSNKKSNLKKNYKKSNNSKKNNTNIINIKEVNEVFDNVENTVTNLKLEEKNNIEEFSRVTRNKDIYDETNDYLNDNDLDTTFVDKVFNVKSNNKSCGKKVNKKKNIIVILLIISLLYSFFITYKVLTVKPKIKTVTKTVEKKIVDDNIVFLGDSITYRYDLEKYFDGYKVVNSGKNGDKTTDILDNMKKRVYDYNPSKVFILIGTNDLGLNGHNVDDIYNNIKEIVSNIKENRPLAEIYIESIYPTGDLNDDNVNYDALKYRDSDDVKELNDKLKEYCKDEKLTYIDLYDKLIDDEEHLNSDYTSDGLHINDDAYEIITNELIKYLK